MSTLFTARTILLIAAVTLLNLFFFRSWDGLGTAILIAALYFLIAFTHIKYIIKQPTKNWFILNSLGVLITIAVVLLRSNNLVQAVAVLCSGLLLLSMWNALQSQQPGVQSFAELVTTPFTAARNHLVGLSRFFLQSAKATKPAASPLGSQKFKSLIIGVVISIPILAVVISLLAAGDPIFQKTIQDIFNIQLQIDEKIGQRILLTLVFSVLLLPFLQRKLGVPFQSPLKGLLRFNLTTEYSVVVLLLTIVLGFFLAVQWQYIFVSVAAETDLSRYGVATYSEYVTRGFGELQFVSLIIYSVVWLGLVFMRASSVAHSVNRLKFLQLILLAEFGIFLISLFRRVWLYQDLHGMTVVKAYGAFFILLVSLFALTLAGRHLNKRAVHWVQVEMGILLAALLLFGSVNVEQYLAVSHPPTVNNRIDHVYLSKLSTDGSAGWHRSLQYAESILTNPELQETSLITEDQRREIAYAGTIVKILQLQHYKLLQTYGSADELNNFYTSTLGHTETRYSEKLMSSLELEGSESATAATLLAEREKVRETLGKVKNLTTTVPMHLNYNPYDLFYSGNTSCNQHSCFLSFFQWQDYQLEEKSVDTLEQWLSYNQPAYSLYTRREEILPLSKLFELEESYFRLLQKIQSQPESEQSFSVDISYYTPFVENI